MIKNFLLTTLLTNLTYLGYHRRFTNSRMFIDLLGLRKELSLHNLNTTSYYFSKILFLLTHIWLRSGCSWILAPKNKFVDQFFPVREYLEKLLFIWTSRWRFGLLTNSSQFLSISSKIVYPSSLVYINYTNNYSRLVEGTKAKLLQIGLADSNSVRDHYNYLINANEKTLRSYLYFINIIFLYAARFFHNNQKSLLF